MKQGNNTLFNLQPLSKLRIYMANKNGLDKPEYSLQELLEVVKDIIHSKGMVTNTTCPQDSFKIVDKIRNIIWSHFTENPAENVDTAVTPVRDTTENTVVEQNVSSGPIEELLHTGMIEDISVSHNVAFPSRAYSRFYEMLAPKLWFLSHHE